MKKSEKDDLLDRIMIEYGNELLRLAFSYVKDVEVAKDLVQNSFIKCYKNIETFRYDSKLKTWLYRITINECKDYLKSWNNKMVRVKDFIHNTNRTVLPSAEKTVMEKYKNKEIKNTIFSLPKVYREIVYLYYYDSMKTEEIADVLDIPVNTVKTRLRRAKQRLRPMLKEAKLYEG